MPITKIISGGQTGVDRAALDVAIQLGIPCGGWCPKGRKAEDGPIDQKYPLQETSSAAYPVRTGRNVKESDGTLILTRGVPTGGTARTIDLAKKHKKPLLIIELEDGDPELVARWIEGNSIRILDVAGPRESKHPGIHDRAVEFLSSVFK